jgi:phosphoglycolate phosphatase-like HAD superfamily hydrolase
VRVALDLDGTLITCEARQSTVLRAVLGRLGVKGIDVRAHWQAKREGQTAVAALVAQGLDEDAARAISLMWQSEVERWPWLRLDVPFADTIAQLDRLVAKGCHLTLLTARRAEKMARLQLSQLGLARFFARIEIVSPATAATAKAALLEQARPAVLIGDSEVDAEAARLSQVPFVAVCRGQRSASFLEARGSEHVYEALAAAIDYCFARFARLD